MRIAERLKMTPVELMWAASDLLSDDSRAKST